MALADITREAVLAAAGARWAADPVTEPMRRASVWSNRAPPGSG